VHERTWRAYRTVGWGLAAGTLVGIGYGSLIGFAGRGASMACSTPSTGSRSPPASARWRSSARGRPSAAGWRRRHWPSPSPSRGLVYGADTGVELGDLGERLVRRRPADSAVDRHMPSDNRGVRPFSLIVSKWCHDAAITGSILGCVELIWDAGGSSLGDVGDASLVSSGAPRTRRQGTAGRRGGLA
jgi:hypothetical protein